ncbi:MAG: hypothetical protein M1587_05770 [Thaumarchaeota archaeon]|nr:hypothetical protein [Nitrososphaerota archaeon]
MMCRNCGKALVKNEKLSKSFTRLFEIGTIEAYFCGSCLDDIYVLYEGKLYDKDEWRDKRDSIHRQKQRAT